MTLQSASLAVAITVLNEGESIRRLLDSLTRQTRRPDSIIICDGGSRDDTVAIVESYIDRLPLRVIVAPGCNISQGRNRAIAAADADLIAVTDAGVALADDWLERISARLLADPNRLVSAGFFQPDPRTVFEAALAATTLPLLDEIDPAKFLPSSRSVAFRKSAWERVGGYPEWLDYCEDLVFDLRLKALESDFAFAPDALVYFRPRSSVRAFFKQYYLYARGDGKADLWRKRHAIRYLTYCAALPAILIATFALHPLFALLGLFGGAIYVAAPVRRLPANLRWLRESGAQVSPAAFIYALALIPFLRAVGDLAKMIGYPVGWRWRLRHHPPDWRR
jgi:glycosyltransferase involved in cell wall biosynthesis